MQYDLFTCKQHTVMNDAAVGEWLGGSLQVLTRNLCQGDCLSIMASGSRRARLTKTSCGRQRFWPHQARLPSLVNSSITISREGSATGTFDSRVAIVFDNCRRLEHFVWGLFPELEKDCAAYCARACWSVILSASRGENKKQYPNVYARAMVELSERERSFPGFARRPRI